MIIFPAAGVFSGLGPMGVSMFFVSYVQLPSPSTVDSNQNGFRTNSAIISQVIYSAGASGFAGANGSMMIEVVVSNLPFHSPSLSYYVTDSTCAYTCILLSASRSSTSSPHG